MGRVPLSKPRYDVVVAGAGLSGLTAAAYLAKAHFSVLLIEKTRNPGGLLHSFQRDGFVFDAGAKSVENAGVVRPLLKDLGIELKLLKSPVTIGIEDQLMHMESPGSLTEYGALLERLYPAQKKEIGRILSEIKKVMKEMRVLYGHDNPVFRNFLKDWGYLFGELLPWFGRFLLAVSRLNRWNEPIEQFLAGISSHQPLNDIVDQHFFKNTPMFFALGYFHVYLDYLYPKGGTGKLAEKLAEKVLSCGGEILYQTEITRISARQKRLSGTNGLVCSYDKLLWCADMKSLYRLADTTGLEPTKTIAIDARKKRIMESRGGDSVFSLYLGLDISVEEFAAKTRGHLFYTPSREGLADTHRGELTELLSTGQDNRGEILAWAKKYCRLTTYEISIPSLRDPELSPKGKTGLIVSFLFEYDLVKKVTEQGWYAEFKKQVEDAIIDVINSSLFPGIRERICLRFSSTPLTYEKQFGSSEGGITGWTFERPSPAVSGILKIPGSVRTHFPGILQAGQWAYSPAGIPTAILTGWYAYRSIKSGHAL